MDMITVGIREIDIDHPEEASKFTWITFLSWKDLRDSLIKERGMSKEEADASIMELKRKGAFFKKALFDSKLLEIEILKID